MDYACNKVQPERMDNRDPQMSPHGCFACAGEDQRVSIACASDEQWQALGIATMPTLTCEDIVNDAHLNARGFIERLDHPRVGAR